MSIKVGVIGVGGMGNSHLSAYSRCEDAEIVAVCDIVEDKAKRAAEEYNATPFFEHKELLKLKDLDAVSVCTPPAMHHRPVVDALLAEKHVICEKPPAVKASQAKEMYEAAKRNNRKLMYGFHRRFSGEATKLKEIVDSGELGEIYKVKAIYTRESGVPGKWFTNKEIAGGGPLLDVGVYPLDLALYMMGFPKPTLVVGSTYACLGGFDVEDTAIGFVKFSNGATMILETSWLQNWPGKVDVILFGTEASASLYPVTLRKEGDSKTYEVERIATHEAEIFHFIECVKEEKEPIPTGEQGYEVMRIVDAIYKSAEMGKPIEIRR